MPLKLKILFSIIILILSIIPFIFLGYGIWAVDHSKKLSDSKKSKAFLGSGITGIIIGASIIAIELLIVILIALYRYVNGYNRPVSFPLHWRSR